MELPPAFVERHPNGNAREVIEVVNQKFEFLAIFLAVFRIFPAKAVQTADVGTVNTRGKGEGDDGVLGGTPTIGHVLPDDHAKAIAGVIPARRLDLDMLADHVTANLFGVFDVKQHGFLRRGSVEPFGKVALVERTKLKDGFIVEREAPETVFIARFAKFAHAEVAADLIHHHPVNFQLNGQIVKMGMVGMPFFGVRDIQQHLAGGSDATPSHFLPLKGCNCFQLGLRWIDRFGQNCLNQQVACVQVGGQFQVADVLPRQHLQPDRLPDTRDRGIPDAARREALFALLVHLSLSGIGDT